MKQRILTTAFILPFFIVAMFLFSELQWRIFSAVLVIMAAREWTRISDFPKKIKWVYLGLTTLICGMFLTSWQFFGQTTFLGITLTNWLYGSALFFWMGCVPIWLRNSTWRAHRTRIMALVGWIVLIPCWIAMIELHEASPWLLIGLMGIVWVADSAAYLFGKRFGRHKLAPKISPGKTWEGVFGAFLGVVLYAGVLSAFGYFSISMTIINMIVGVTILWALTGLSIVGDLFESMMKRQVGLKDSGRLLPGHGGLLDRIDSLTAMLPIAALALSAKVLV